MSATFSHLSKIMDVEGWKAMWKEDLTPWHSKHVNPKLKENLELLMGRHIASRKPAEIRFFVPLCGKSVDMIFLYQQGYTVIGCEAVEKACNQFFQDNKLDVRPRQEIGSEMSLFQSIDGRLQIYCGDFFKLTPETIGGRVDCVFDRGSLVAITLDQREKYASIMGSLVEDNFYYLLITVERENPPNLPEDMPRNVTYHDAKLLFRDFCSVRLLEQNAQNSNANFEDGKAADTRPFKTNVMFLKRKLKEDEDDLTVYWHDRWVEGKAFWHNPEPHPYLRKYFHLLTKGRENLRFLVPMCGKSKDLVWLYQQGHRVVGVEVVAYAVEQFFKEADLAFVKERCQSIDGWMLKTSDDGGRLTVYVCDFFDVTPSLFGIKGFDCVLDRGSFGAIEYNDRARYVDLIRSLLVPDYQYFLETFSYDESEKFNGPPRRVNRGELDNLFSNQGTNDRPPSKIEFLEAYQGSNASRYGINKYEISYFLIHA